MDREHIPHPPTRVLSKSVWTKQGSNALFICMYTFTSSRWYPTTDKLSLFSYFYRRYPSGFPCPTNATTGTNTHLSLMLTQLQHLGLKSSFLPPHVLIELRQLVQEGYCLSGEDKFVASRPMQVVSRTSWFTGRQSSSSSTTANSSSHVEPTRHTRANRSLVS